jgi:hypothetical protein
MSCSGRPKVGIVSRGIVVSVNLMLSDCLHRHRRITACAQALRIEAARDDDHVAIRKELDHFVLRRKSDTPAPRSAGSRRENNIRALTRGRRSDKPPGNPRKVGGMSVRGIVADRDRQCWGRIGVNACAARCVAASSCETGNKEEDREDSRHPRAVRAAYRVTPLGKGAFAVL